jgi:ATP-dependent protease ClpP protease subunit
MKESEFSHNRMLRVLEDSTNELDTKEIRSKLLKPTDTWLTVEDMIEYGLADHILN